MIPAQQAQALQPQELEPQLQEPVSVQEFLQQVLAQEKCRTPERNPKRSSL
jgi:hypothetical protein